MTESHLAVGIDIGGTAIKAALVDVSSGQLASDHHRVRTPRGAEPEAVTRAVAALVGPLLGPEVAAVGAGFPAVIKNSLAMSAENIDDRWCYRDVAELLGEALGVEVSVLNDADAAGLAEVRFGAGQGVSGVVVVITLGTGVGTGLFADGKLVANMELGRIPVRGLPAGERVADSVRVAQNLGWDEWAADLQEYLAEIDEICWPELIVVGGGASTAAHRFLPGIKTRAQLLPARLRNHAGVIGAATHAFELKSIHA
jgi:polyphosphate glucokinase